MTTAARTLIFCSSIVIPGIGHIMTGRYIAGVLAGATLLSCLTLSSYLVAKNWAGFLASIVLSLILILPIARNASRRAQRTVWNSWRGIAHVSLYALVFITVSLSLRPLQGAAAFVVSSDTMAPALLRGDQVIVDRIAYRHSFPRIGEIIAYRDHRLGLLMERVIALPGDTVESVKGFILIDDKPLEPHEKFNPELYHAGENAEFPEAIVPDDHVFVLPDVRPMNSRRIVFVPRSAIIGRVSYVFASLPEGEGAPDLNRVGLPIH
ncbi:MAG: signal peptidase I [Bdellovibrionaceae bacterium]|nr:signal peptidase I [Pseudobdellovibrionaceae bacterium]